MPEPDDRAAESGPVEDAPQLPEGVRGPELARAVLDAARARRGAIGGPRDPQPLGAVLAKLMKDRGWQRPAAEASLFGRWEAVVGPEVASRCRPVKLVDG